jgi:hypothetical protein
MAAIECEVTIDASPESVYAASQDYSVRYLWDPFPEKIELLGGAESIAKGVKVFVLGKFGLNMVVEFVQVDRPATAAIKMVEGPFFLQSFAGSWVFKPAGSRSTKARFIYSIKAKKWALPFLADAIATWYFSGIMKRRLEGLKSYCERHA